MKPAIAMQDSLHDIDHVIGIDLGDGESALAWCATAEFSTIAVYQRQTTGERNIITAIARSPGDRRRLIGEEAIAMTGAEEFTLNFKTAPDPDDLTTPDSILFIQTLLGEFFTATREVTPSRSLLIVGHPAGWEGDTVLAFSRHLAALRMPVRVLPESQAALIHVRGPLLDNLAPSDVQNTDEQTVQRVLVVDIGSSTTDFTFIENFTPRNLALGASFGCRAIDLQVAGLVSGAFARQSEVTAALEADGGQQFLLLACRKAKEAQFGGSSPTILDQRINARFRPLVSTAWNWLRAIDIAELIASKGGWLEQLRTLLQRAANELAENEPERVILTGGGSRIPAAKLLCEMVLPSAEVYYDAEPSLSVARGLALAGLHQVRVSRFRGEISELLQAATFVALCEGEINNLLLILKRQFAAKLRAREGVTSSDFHPSLTQMGNNIAAYLSERVPRICRAYGVNDSELDFDVEIPIPIADKITAYFSNYLSTSSRVEAMAAEARLANLNRSMIRRISPPKYGPPSQMDQVWAAVELLGRAYQFWKRQSLRRDMSRIVDAIRDMELGRGDLDELVMRIQAHIQVQFWERIQRIEDLIF